VVNNPPARRIKGLFLIGSVPQHAITLRTKKP
jgi:hypothetical protein